MPEASFVRSRWLSAAAPSGFGCKKKCGLNPGWGARIVGRVVARWLSEATPSGYEISLLRTSFGHILDESMTMLSQRL
ncbi:MAG: hypothetical protein DWH73_01965 [Planctomycetota bacterium]|nr:MAG: hypothetical protein DWH73_01965 [Planctomycetota bacterium]